MNTKKQLNNILNKFPKTELGRVELARKPQTILSDLNKLDNRMRVQENKMSKIYQQYKNVRAEFIDFMKDSESFSSSLIGDINDVIQAAKELGVTDYKSIDGLGEAEKLANDLKRISKDFQSLYKI
jgi:archaellum component FlaC